VRRRNQVWLSARLICARAYAAPGRTAWLASQDDPAQAAAAFQRFRDRVDATPSLQAHQYNMNGQLIAIAAQVIADQVGMTTPNRKSRRAL
jgi:hypothetical protein